MGVDLILKNGWAVLDDGGHRLSVAITGGRIDGLYAPGNEPHAHETIDCEGLYLLPGAIDMHVHMRDLEQSEKEDYGSGTRAAAAGGVTSVVDMPNSQPPALTAECIALKTERAREDGYVNVGFYGGVPEPVSEFEHEMTRDILGLKVYPHSPLVRGVVYDHVRIERCVRLAASLGLPLLFHPDVTMHEDDDTSAEGFSRRHSCSSEHSAVRQFTAAQQEVGGRLHVCHVSCASVVQAVQYAKCTGDVTAEVTPHHLLLNRLETKPDNGISKVLPPLRLPADNAALYYGLKQQIIDCVASDHAPHTAEEKRAPFERASSGIPGLETMVPLIASEVFSGRLSWGDYLGICCKAPARILGLERKGALARGCDADIVAIRREEWTIRGDRFYSKSRLTPFEGRRVLARPVLTIVGGEVVFRDGRFETEPGTAGVVPLRRMPLAKTH